jgi:sarcosine oxidase subunit gamma
MASSNSDNTSNGAPDAQTPQASALPEILPNPEGGAAGISIAKVAGRTLINLRCEDIIKAKLEALFGTPLLAEPNKVASIGTRRAIWLGPDETLLMIEEEQEAEFMLNLKALLGTAHYAATPVSDAIKIFRLGGTRRLDVLAKGCALDLHPASFKQGDCAQSMLAHAAITLAADTPDSLLLFCRTSYSDYVTSWLKDAAVEYGYILLDNA